MDLVKKFVFIMFLVFLWDSISFLIENDFKNYLEQINVFNFMFKVLMVFLIFLGINKLLSEAEKHEN
ncbi:hypothetical protein AWE51_15765 [Aquimarina aggregata]|uniref:Uncharacterized protein n=1 Tax=Aquimarina aggregata TaxID=1642818 RepID=A0A162CVK7_9FLAO|nr:hypothetical protein AWE51_15765 [Aquimarina aggregata]